MTSLSARAPSSISPKGLTRAAYARKVFVASKTGYLMKKSGTELRESNGKGVIKIKFMNNYVTKKRFFVLTGASLMYHRDHRKLDDPTSSKVCVVFVWCVCVYLLKCVCRAQTSQTKK